jgi:hypothetical protein
MSFSLLVRSLDCRRAKGLNLIVLIETLFEMDTASYFISKHLS